MVDAVISGQGTQTTGVISKSGAPLANLPFEQRTAIVKDFMASQRPIDTQAQQNATQFAKFQDSQHVLDTSLRGQGILQRVTPADVEGARSGIGSSSQDSIPQSPPMSTPITQPKQYTVNLNENLGVGESISGGKPPPVPSGNTIIGYTSGFTPQGVRFQTPIFARPQAPQADIPDPFSSESTKSLSNTIGSEVPSPGSLSIPNLIENSFKGKTEGETALGNGLISLANQQIIEKNQQIGLGNALADISNQQNIEKAQKIGLGNALIDLSNQQITAKNAASKAQAEFQLHNIVSQGLLGNAKQFDIYNATGAKIGSIPANANSFSTLNTLLDTGEPLSIRATNPQAQETARTLSLSNLQATKSFIQNARESGVKSINVLGPSVIGGAFGSQGIKIGTTTPDNALRDVLGYQAKGVPVSLSYVPPIAIYPKGVTAQDIAKANAEVHSNFFGEVLKGYQSDIGSYLGKDLGPTFGGIVTTGVLSGVSRAPSSIQSSFPSFGTKLYTPSQPNESPTINKISSLVNERPGYALGGLAAEAGIQGLTFGGGKVLETGLNLVKAGLGTKVVNYLSFPNSKDSISKPFESVPIGNAKTVRTYPTYAATNMYREKLPSDLFSLDTEIGKQPLSQRIPTPRNTLFEDITKETSTKLQKTQNDLLKPAPEVKTPYQPLPEETNPLGRRGKPPISLTTFNDITQIPRANVVEQTTPRLAHEVFNPLGEKLSQTVGDLTKPVGALGKSVPKITIEPTPPEILNPLGRRGNPPVKISSPQEQGVVENYSDILNRQFTPEETLKPTGKPGSINTPFINILERNPPPISQNIKSSIIPTDLSEFYMRPGKIDTDRLLGIEQPDIGESKSRLTDIIKAAKTREERENPKETTGLTAIGTPEFGSFPVSSQSFKLSSKPIGLDLQSGIFTSTSIDLGKGIGFRYTKGEGTKLGFDINKPTKPFDFFGPQPKKTPKGETKGNQVLLQIEKEITKEPKTTEVKSTGYREDNISLGKGNLIELKPQSKTTLNPIIKTQTQIENQKYLESLSGRKRVRITSESDILAYPSGTKSDLTGKQRGLQELKIESDILKQTGQKQTQANQSGVITRLTSEFNQRLNQKTSLSSLSIFRQGQGQALFTNAIQTNIPRQTTEQTQAQLSTNSVLSIPKLSIPSPYPFPTPFPTLTPLLQPRTPPPKPPPFFGSGGFDLPFGNAGGKKRKTGKSIKSFFAYSVNPNIAGAIEQAGLPGLQTSSSSSIYGKVDKQLAKATRLNFKGTKIRF